MSTGIRFLRRRSLGSYEHTELEISDVVPEGASPVAFLKEIMTTVEDALYAKGSFGENAPAVSKGPKVAAVVKAKKEAVVAEEVQPELPLHTEVLTQLADSVKEEVVVIEERKVEEKKVEEKKAPKKETKVVAKKTKATDYDRTLDAHKNVLGLFLDSKYKSWRKPENLKKAGTASRDLQGKPFLDGDGEILDSFKEAFTSYMVDLVD